MPSTYSNLKIQLMATGENNTTWGNVTNVNLGTAIEEAIAGSADVTFASNNQTISLTDTNATQTARNMRLNCTGTTGGSTRTLTVPTIEKLYVVKNGCADTITVKTSAGTGIDVPAGKTMWVVGDGTNVVDVTTHLTTLTLGTPLPVASGGTGANTAANALSNLGGLSTGTNINVTAITGLSDGSASAPTIYWGSDSNTGFYHPAADTLAATTGGSAAMFINPTGTNSGAVALGAGVVTSTNASVVLGTAANGSGSIRSFIGGYQALGGTATNSVVIGADVDGRDTNSVVAIGRNVVASNSATSIVLGGADTAASGMTNSIVIGTGINARDCSATVVIGTGANSWSENDNVLIGNGVETLYNDCVLIGSGVSNTNITSGARATIIGRSATSSSQNTTAVGYLTSAGHTNAMVLGNQAASSAANQITLGNSSISQLRCQVTTITSLSDRRDKSNIQPINIGLDFINRLNPISFTWNMRDGGRVGDPDIGFVAQELIVAQEKEGIYVPGLVSDIDPDRLEAGYGTLIPILVRAVQELSSEVEYLKTQINGPY